MSERRWASERDSRNITPHARVGTHLPSRLRSETACELVSYLWHLHCWPLCEFKVAQYCRLYNSRLESCHMRPIVYSTTFNIYLTLLTDITNYTNQNCICFVLCSHSLALAPSPHQLFSPSLSLSLSAAVSASAVPFWMWTLLLVHQN